MKNLLRILSFLFLPLLVHATHQVSGYITFKCIGGDTYIVTVIDYTNTCNTDADRDTITINYGDGTSQTLYRSNGPVDGAGFHQGEPLCDCRKMNVYSNGPSGHQFPGNGTYRIWFDDQDRMANICNMTTSVSQDFYLFTTLTINAFAGSCVSSPLITNEPVCVYACTGQCFNFNLGAYSTEGDSIAYSLGNCLSLPGTKTPGYNIPSGATIDHVTGTLSWCYPIVCKASGIFNFSIRLVSYKHTIISGTSFKFPVDTMDCELEVIVQGSCSDSNPTITGPTDTCVLAGSLVSLNYTAKDNNSYLLTMSASGEPFALSPAATFTSGNPANPITGTFKWQTNCSEVRSAPYSVVVAAKDTASSGYTSYSTYQNTNITVVAPAPTNLQAKVNGNSVFLHWNPSTCGAVTGYNIYRHVGCYSWKHGPCETGVPSYTGYTYIGHTTGGINDTTFYDYNVLPGINYSYLVVAAYPLPDGALSYASNDTCVLVRRNLPLLINVSVDSTSTTSGTIFTRWLRPLADSGYLDTNGLPGPYTYKLLRATGMNGKSFTPVVTRTSPYFGSTTDTTYKDQLLNTQDSSYNYRLDFYYKDTVFLGSVPTASSIYLTLKPGDNYVQLFWSSAVPWTDNNYLIYRKDPGGSTFNYVTTVPGTVHSYMDTMLTNTRTYCFYVKSQSSFADTTILHPLYDSSEIQCAAPKDTIAPCTPNLHVAAMCNTFQDSLIWNNPDHFCKNTHDVMYYNIYYSPTEGGDMQLLATINNANDTVYLHDSLTSVAGCYAVTAVDSFMNESSMSPVCVDNCPQYQLPNIFTPNGDGMNDLFTPLLPYRYIKSIDINIYNRWGQVMFHTINPMINWDGKDQSTGGLCPDGVYYYICTVNEIRVTGIQPIVLKGFIELLRKK